MKKSLLIWLLLLWSFALIGCYKIADEKVVLNSVYDYNDILTSYFDECFNTQDYIWNLYNDIQSSSEDVVKAIDQSVEICNKAQYKINTLWDWEWDASLKDITLEYLEMYVEYYTLFKEWVPYSDTVTVHFDERTDSWKLYKQVTEFYEEVSEFWDKVSKVQNNFLKKYWSIKKQNVNEEGNDWESIIYYENGNIKEKWEYEDWQRIWEWTEYYENWNIFSKWNYVNWLEDGDLYQYNEDWTLFAILNYKEWEFIDWEWYKEDWTIMTEEEVNELVDSLAHEVEAILNDNTFSFLDDLEDWDI